MTERLACRTVGIAGCGGLGSNAALALARAGVGRLVLADFDRVEESNLNRQAYFHEDLGKVKVEALAAHLKNVNREIRLEVHCIQVTPEKVIPLFSEADLLVEAFDRAESKEWLIESWCASFPRRPIICASGLSGLGGTEKLTVRSAGRIIFCGDESSEMDEGLCSARVAITANMQANEAIRILAGAAPGEPC